MALPAKTLILYILQDSYKIPFNLEHINPINKKPTHFATINDTFHIRKGNLSFALTCIIYTHPQARSTTCCIRHFLWH